MTLETLLKEAEAHDKAAEAGRWEYVPDTEFDDWQIIARYESGDEVWVKQDDSGVPISPENARALCFARNNLAKLIEIIQVQREALEYLSCDGMDDGDFYAEEDIVAGTIKMANRAREALSQCEQIAGRG